MYETILVPVDGSDNAMKAVEEAAALAKSFDSTLQIVSVASDQRYVQYGVTLGQDVMESFRERADEILDDAKEIAEKKKAPKLKPTLLSGFQKFKSQRNYLKSTVPR